MRKFIILTVLLALAGAGFGASLEQTLTFERSSFRLARERGYTRILSRTVPVTPEAGNPELPEKPVYIILPPGTRVSGLRVLEANEETFPGTYLVFPRQKEVPSNEKLAWTEPDPAAYASNLAYPGTIAQLVGQGDFHGQRIACVLVHPLRYVASEGRLLFTSRMRLELELAPDSKAPLVQRREFSEDREKREAILHGIAANPEALGIPTRPEEVSGWSLPGGFAPTEEPSPTGSPVRYVIITNEAMAPVFQGLADYKTRVGTPAVVRTVAWIKAHYTRGVDDAETIRNFLKDAYRNWGTSAVLLGGDCDIVPIRFTQWGGWSPPQATPGDYYYQCLDGTWDENHNGIFGEANGDDVDLFPELMIGRASVRNSEEALVFVNKTLRFFDPQDKSYQTTFLLIGQSVFRAGDGAEWCNIMASYAPPEFRLIKLYEPDYCQGNLTRDSLLFYLNQGQGLIYSQNHGQADQIEVRGHLGGCKEMIYRPDLDALTNRDRTSFWYSVNCDGNAVDRDCMGEHFMRNPHGGGIGFYGATRLNFPQSGFLLDATFFDSLFSRGHLRVGEAVNDSKIPFIGSSQGENAFRLLLISNVLLGDPDLAVWATTPKVMSLDFPGTVPLGPATFRVRVTSLLGPVSKARVTVSKAGEVYASGFTDSRGEVVLSFVPQTPGEIEVAARKDNYLVREETAYAYPQAPFVTAYHQKVQDDTSAASSGNGNGVLEAGETVALWLSLKNTGGATARGLRTVLRTIEAYVAILDSAFSVPVALAPGDTFVSPVPLRFRLASDMLDGKTLEFSLATTDSSGAVFTQKVAFDGRAPVLSQIGQIVDDDTVPPTRGNGNGIPEPGETVGLVLRLKNYGGGQNEGVTVKLFSRDSLVVVLDSTAEVGRIPAYGERLTSPGEEVLFKVKKNRIGGGYRLRLRLEDAYGRRKDRDFELVPMMRPGALWDEPDSASITLHWDPLPYPKTYCYNLYRADRTGGPYLRVNPDPVASPRFADDGLPRGRTYYYVATAMDTSLNESGFSPELAAATFPLYRPGWPREMPTQILSTPVACDLDPAYPGKEVIAAALDNRIYAWHADGTGLTNPDGLFKTVPGAYFFVTSAAAGDLDGNGTPEIVESTFFCDTPRVFVWKADGSDLPGWPRSLEGNACHASPVLYDLDGDGWPEVIQATMPGRIYVWKHDGSGYRDSSGLFTTITDSLGVWVMGTPAVGDIDGEGRPEIMVSGGDGGNHKLYAFRWDGTPEPNFPIRFLDRVISSPALGDIDPSFPGLEIVVLSKDNLVHALRADGQEVAGWPQGVIVASGDASSVIADLDRDGRLEVVMAGDNQLYVFRADGSAFPGFPISWGGTSFSSPAVGDMDGDGLMEIVAGGQDEKAYAWHSDGAKLLGFPFRTWGTFKSSATLSDLGDGRVSTILGCYDYFLYVWQTMAQPGAVRLEWWTFHHDEWRTGQYGFVPPRLGVEEGPGTGLPFLLPRETALFQSTPNPMVSGATIHYDLAQEAQVWLAVYNVAGERVRTLTEGRMKPGAYSSTWDGRDEKGTKVASGVYFYRLKAGNYVKTMKMVVTR
jgi:hypothetical protein